MGVNGEALQLHVFGKKMYSLLQVTNSVVCSKVALDLIQAVAYSVICLGAASLLVMQYIMLTKCPPRFLADWYVALWSTFHSNTLFSCLANGDGWRCPFLSPPYLQGLGVFCSP